MLILLLTIEDMIHFPVTQKKGGEDVYFGNMTFYAAKTSPDISTVTWIKISTGSPHRAAQLYLDDRLFKDPSTALSVMSSFQGYCDFADFKDTMWMWYTPKAPGLYGASEGIACLLAMMGYKSDKCITGLVRVLGSDAKDLLNYEVGTVDCVPIKAEGNRQKGVEFGFPAEDPYRGYGTPIKTVGDAVRFVTS